MSEDMDELKKMTEEMKDTPIEDIQLSLHGSLRSLEEPLRQIVQVANNHEGRYHDTWLHQDPDALKILLQDKMGRKLKFMRTPADKMEEIVDGIVYALMYLYHLQQLDPDFKYPDSTMKHRRDHANV